MKATLRFSTHTLLFFLFFFCVLPMLSGQNTGQRIRVYQGEAIRGSFDSAGGTLIIQNEVPLTFQVFDSLGTVPNQACEGELDQDCGWYKGFWLMGDGNYIKFAENLRTLDADSRIIRNYSYPQAGTYQPVVYLTEKYHNDNPPEAARVTINKTAGAGNFSETPIRLAAPERKVDIDFNHAPRVKYPTNFVVSYRNDDNNARVLFYYNALGRAGSASIAPVSLMRHRVSEYANYHNTGVGPVVTEDILSSATGAMPLYTGTILDALNSKFKSFLAYNVDQVDSDITPGRTELRVFPVLESFAMTDLPGDSLPGKPMLFAAVLIGTSPVSTDDPAYSKLVGTAKGLLGDTIPDNLQLSPNSDLFIRGIEMLELNMLRSHDPNSLTVTDIRDLGNGQYRAFFRMIICNEGSAPETKISLIFNDLTGGKYGARPDITNVTAGTWTGGSNGAPWEVPLLNFQISGVPENYKPSCKSVLFSIDTDLDGIQRLYQETPRALNVCVRFSSGAGECSENEPLPSGTYQDNGKYLPAEEEPCDLLTLILAALAALGIIGLLFGYLLKKKKQAS